MNVYDFDGTIYRGDSTVDFYLFCLRRHPAILRYLPRQAGGAALHALGRLSKREMKERFFSFLRGLPAVEEDLERFWRENRQKLMPWYSAQRLEDDVIISASPEFLLEGACRELGVRRLIASRVDPRTGAFLGENCRGEEKVRRFRQAFPDGEIGAFYSDGGSDLPLARLAEHACRVRGTRIGPWAGSEEHTHDH